MGSVGTNGSSEACIHLSLSSLLLHSVNVSPVLQAVPGGRVRMSQLTFPLTDPSSVGTFKSVHSLVNTKHVAGSGLIKTNITVS